MGAGKKNRISVWNWLGTLILCAIPGVNLIATILFLIFAKAQAKRTFAWAMLILILLGIALTCAAFLVFTNEIAAFAAQLRNDPRMLMLPGLD